MAGLKKEPGVYCWNVHSIDYVVYFMFVDVCVCLCVRPSVRVWVCVRLILSLCVLVRLCDEWQTCEQSAQKFSLFLQFACSLGKAIALKNDFTIINCIHFVFKWQKSNGTMVKCKHCQIVDTKLSIFYLHLHEWKRKKTSKPKTKYAPESLTGPFQFWHTIDRDGYQIFISTMMMVMIMMM